MVFILFTVASFPDGKDNPPEITLEKIFKDKEYKSNSFGPFKWEQKGHSFTLLKPAKKNKKIKELYRYYPDKKRYKKLIGIDDLSINRKKKELLKIEKYSISPDRKKVLIFTKSKYVWRTKTRGNYWIFTLDSRKLHKTGVGLPESSMMFAKFSPDSKRIAYVSDRNIYVEDVTGGTPSKLTDSGSESIINGTFDWVYEEEFHMKDGFRWSPDGKNIAFWQFDISGVKDFYLIDNTSDTYSKLIPLQYPKAGETNSSCRIGIIKSSGGDIRWIKFKGNPRMNYIARMEWAESPEELIIQRLNRSQNRNNVWIFNIKSGFLSNIISETDEVWLDVMDKFLWVSKGKSLLWLSERDGWRHIYNISRDGGNIKLITPGEFDVVAILGIDEEKNLAYFSASPENPTQLYLYSASITGEPMIKKVTPRNISGTNYYSISKDSKSAIHYHSTFDTPEEISLVSLPEHKRELLLEDNKKLKEKILEFSFPQVEFFQLDIGNGINLDCWMMKPADFNENKKYPVIFYVYGEPWGQTVKDSWRGNGYMWHRLLNEEGYIVMSIDNRGTPAPKGRNFRKIVYKKLGIMTSEDQYNGVLSAIKKFSFLDKDRIGVWGWSGGGSMTLNLMFRFPNLYKTGISVAPVTDMRYYDSVYQERYMGNPKDNMDAYIKGSPITYAKNLKGNLLLVHGTGDDNVHFQNSEALINKLIEYNKQFSIMIYPNRRHSIRKGKNTRLHLYTLMTRFFKNNL